MRRSNLLFIAFRFRLFCFRPRQSSVFCQSAVSRETISKMATDFPAQCVIANLPSRWFPFRHALFPCRAFPKWPPDDDEAAFDPPLFSRFLLSNLFHVKHSAKTPPNGAGWRFLHFKCVSRKTFSKNSPRRHAFRCLETVSCKKLSKANCHRPFAMTFTFYVSRETYGTEHPIKKKKARESGE